MRSVLVVDDEPLILDDVAAMLEELGCIVLTAANGAEALQRLAENNGIEISRCNSSEIVHVLVKAV